MPLTVADAADVDDDVASLESAVPGLEAMVAETLAWMSLSSDKNLEFSVSNFLTSSSLVRSFFLMSFNSP